MFTTGKLHADEKYDKKEDTTEHKNLNGEFLVDQAFLPDFRESIVKDSSRTFDIQIIFIIGGLNCIVMLLSDLLYVYIIFNYNAEIVAMAEVVLALFKVLLNNTLLWRAIPYFHELLKPTKSARNCTRLRQSQSDISQETSSQPQAFEYQYSRKDINFLTFTILLNNLIFPAIAIFIVSSDCFHYALFEADGVSSSYEYEICPRYLVLTGRCVEPKNVLETTSYNPPFVYSFQCASRVVVSYVAVLMLMFIFEGMIQPLYKLSVKFLYDRYWSNQPLPVKSTASLVEDKKPEGGNDVNVSIISNPIVTSSPSEVMDSKDNKLSDNASSASLEPNQSIIVGPATPPFVYRLLFATLPYNLQRLNSEPSTAIKASSRVLFDQNRVVVKLNSYFVVFMSFGVLFPPLALIIFLAVMSLTLYEETVIGRILYDSERLHYHWYRMQLERNCSGISSSLKYALWAIIPASCLLFAYLIFDTWGDEEGWSSALGPTMAMLCVPVIVLFMYSSRKTILRYFYGSSELPKSPSNGEQEGDVETTTNMEEKTGRVVSANHSGIMLTDIINKIQ